MKDLTKDDFNIGECTVEKQDKAFIKIFVDTLDDAEQLRNKILSDQETLYLVTDWIKTRDHLHKFTTEEAVDTIETILERPDLG